jgi:hypothetical protein
MVVTGRLVGISLLAATLLALLVARPAGGFTLNDECDLTIQSLSEDGQPLDSASPGSGGTQDDPFLIDWEGTVRYEGNTGSHLGPFGDDGHVILWFTGQLFFRLNLLTACVAGCTDKGRVEIGDRLHTMRARTSEKVHAG